MYFYWGYFGERNLLELLMLVFEAHDFLYFHLTLKSLTEVFLTKKPFEVKEWFSHITNQKDIFPVRLTAYELKQWNMQKQNNMNNKSFLLFIHQAPFFFYHVSIFFKVWLSEAKAWNYD